jgi:hypothetical protein
LVTSLQLRDGLVHLADADQGCPLGLHLSAPPSFCALLTVILVLVLLVSPWMARMCCEHRSAFADLSRRELFPLLPSVVMLIFLTHELYEGEVSESRWGTWCRVSSAGRGGRLLRQDAHSLRAHVERAAHVPGPGRHLRIPCISGSHINPTTSSAGTTRQAC